MANTVELDALLPSQIFALSKALSDNAVKAARAQLREGEHVVPTFQVEIGGTLDVRPDEDYIPTISISIIGATAMALRRMGIQRDPFLAALKEVCTEALNADEKTREALLADANVKEWEAEFREKCTRELPQSTRNGKVLRRLTVKTP